MRVGIGLAVLAIFTLTACQPQEIDYDKIAESVARAIEKRSSVQVSFYGSGAELIELNQGDYNIYAVATRADFTSDVPPEIQVKIKPVGGLWTELISVKGEGDEDVLFGGGNLKIENPGLYILHGSANEYIWSWWNVDLILR